MRIAMPVITESATELQQRMQREPDRKKRQRLHALYLAASGQTRYRHQIARVLGVHRHSVAAWFAAYTQGGLAAALWYQVPQPPRRQRITPAALHALRVKLQEPAGFPSYHHIRTWLAAEHDVHLAYSSVHELVRYKLQAKPKRPRPSHRKKKPRP